MFLRNMWYVGAYSDEVADNLLSRKICNEPVLMYRKQHGDPVAIGNMCPHRFAPLGMGKKFGDVVECPYHGLRFDSSGKCVLNPHETDRIPDAAVVPSYPLVERHGCLWLWFGEEEPNEALIPDFSCLTDNVNFTTVKGVITMAANYELITDNLVDLTHAEYIHEGILGSEAISRGHHTVQRDGLTLQSNRWCPDGLAPPAWDQMFDNYGKPVDHWLDMRWDPPAHMLLDVGVTPTGRPRAEGISVLGTDILTPETETTTHYFWGISRRYQLQNPAAGEAWRDAIKAAFIGQDKPILEAVQSMMGEHSFEELKPVILKPDAGALGCRRILNELRKKQSQSVSGSVAAE